MSVNQTRAEKSEAQLRKPGRSGSSSSQRNFSGGGKGGWGTAHPPSSSISTAPSFSANRSFKKSSTNGQGGQARTAPLNANCEPNATNAAARISQDSAHAQSQLLDAPVSGASKLTEASGPKSSWPVPRVPPPQPTSTTPDVPAPEEPSRGDVSRAFPLQFGSISPGLMNGMQIPARTSSAPPNLDEQKRDQLPLIVQFSSSSKPQQLKQDAIATSQPHADSHPPSQAKIDTQLQSTAALVVSTTQKSAPTTTSGMSMQMPYQQPQLSLQFGNAMQSQSVSASSLQMQMTLPVSNASQVQQQVFVPGLQSISLPHQGLMRPGQNIGFAPQMGHQLGPQLGNLGIGVAPQFNTQQAGKFGGPRKTVKITHPETHEELKFDKGADAYLDVGSSGSRGHHPSVPPQSQPIQSFSPAHSINYFPPLQHNSYNRSMFFSSPTSLPLTSAQMSSASSATRYNYPVGQGGPPISFMNPVLNSLPVSKAGPPPMHAVPEPANLDHARDNYPSSASFASASVRVTVKPAVKPLADKVGTIVTVSSPMNRGESPALRQPGDAAFPNQHMDDNKQPKAVFESTDSMVSPVTVKHPPTTTTFTSVSMRWLPSSTSSLLVAPVEESAAVVTSREGQRKEPIRRSDSLKDQQRKPGKKEQRHSEQHHQEDSSDSSGAPRSPRLKFPGNISSSDLHAVQASSMLNITSPLETVGEANAASANFMSNIPSSEAEEAKVTSLSANSGVTLHPAGLAQHAHIGSSAASATSAIIVIDGEDVPCDPSNPSYLEAGMKASDKAVAALLVKADDCGEQDVVLKQETMGAEECRSTGIPIESLQEVNYSKVVSLSTECDNQAHDISHTGVISGVDEKMMTVGESNGSSTKLVDANDTAIGSNYKEDRTVDNFIKPYTTMSGLVDPTTASSSHASSTDASEEKASSASKLVGETLMESGMLSWELTTSTVSSASSETTWKNEGKGEEVTNCSQTCIPSLGSSKDKVSTEQNKTKAPAGKRKKRREFLMKADAAGSTSDLYNAYKGPEEKHEISSALERIDSAVDANLAHTDNAEKDIVVSEDDAQGKSELDDWEDAAEIPTPKLKALENGNLFHSSAKLDEEYGGGVKKRYTRDFLLTFQEHKELPAGFEIGSDIDSSVGGAVASSYVTGRDSYASGGRVIDRPSGGSRRGSVVDDDKWGKAPGSFAMGWDPRLDGMHGGVAINFRPGQMGNHGVLRNPRGQSSGQYVGGILSGPMLGLSSSGGMPRNSPDAVDRWQRNKGLIAAPQTPLQVMHKAERKYEVGKVSDFEDAKQRLLKAILNKLTPQNFDKLFEQVKKVNIDTAVTLTAVISQIFDKALMEPTFCEMYADFCYHLAGALPDFNEDNEKITFKRVLLSKCQEEFERGEKEQAEANRVEEEGEVKQSAEEREEKRVKARRRMLGNIRLIGELYKKKMLTERIMHECIKKLLGQYQNPDEEDVEALCKLMSTIGEMIDHPKAKEHMDAYFDMMQKLSNNQKLSSRVRFMLKDAIDLRKNKWQQRRKVEGPKKIEEVHRDAAQERQLHTNRLSRGGSSINSTRRGPPIDYNSRVPAALSSSAQQMSSSRNMPSQMRGYGAQDVRIEDRHTHESRMLSVPLPQRSIDDDSITLGPQGGLGRGMSIRGQQLMPSVPLANVASAGDHGRIATGSNGYSSASDYAPYSSREEHMPRYIPERFVGTPAYEQSNSLEHNASFGSRDSWNMDRSFDRLIVATPTTVRMQGISTGVQNTSSKPKISEDQLRSQSISAIREYYSARNEDEVRLCIKDLNSPGFYSDMVSLWVTDSFERKNEFDRDLLAKLLVNLCNSRGGLLSHVQLIKGFEGVLSTLEDAVTDSPKAAEYLGRILGKVVVENVVRLEDVGRIIYEGGEEPGRLVETGLALDVLFTIFEIIKRDRGDTTLNEMRVSSNFRLEDFRHPDPIKFKRLEAFL